LKVQTIYFAAACTGYKKYIDYLTENYIAIQLHI